MNDEQLREIIEFHQLHAPAFDYDRIIHAFPDASTDERWYLERMITEFIHWVQHPNVRDDQEIAVLEERIREIKRHKQQRIEEYGERITELARHVPNHYAAKWAAALYWNEWEGVKVPAKILATLLNCKTGSVWMHVPKVTEVTTCRRCQKEFHAQRSSRSNPYVISYLCEECASAAEIEMSQARQAEQERITALRAMPYRDYLQTEHWKALRQQMLKRARYRCQLCNRGDVSLHVHHRTYENRGDERYSDLIVLCADCHQTFHERMELEA